MDNWNNLISGLALSQLLFLGSFIYTSFNREPLARYLGLFTLCLICFLLGGIEGGTTNPLLDGIRSSLAILTPAALWLFSVAFFRDEKNMPVAGLSLICIYFTFNTVYSLLTGFGFETGQIGYVLGSLFPQIAMFGLSLHVVYMGIEGRRADLLEERRKFRIPFVISMGIVVLFTLSFGLFTPLLQSLLPEDVSLLFLDSVSLIIVSAVFLWTLILNLAIFRLNRNAEFLLQNDPAILLERNGDSRPPDKEEKLINKINEAMGQQQLYKEVGFTITKLAQHLSISEPRLRKVINQTMGYRNFNQFLNRYRIGEATQVLAESEEAISIVAMEVGYNSLSAFNKAFKEIHGVPPREFRSAAANDSKAAMSPAKELAS